MWVARRFRGCEKGRPAKNGAGGESMRGGERLPYGWRLLGSGVAGAETVRNFLRPALKAAPPEIAARLGFCRVAVRPELQGERVTSAWTRTALGFDIELAAEGIEPHDLALELLRCLGQALWEKLREPERAAWLKLLEAEIAAAVEGEIDEDALERKRALFANREAARDPGLLLEYAAASFAGTVAEYIHALWHDVTVRAGAERLPAAWLRRRLEFLARRYPPAHGRRLFG